MGDWNTSFLLGWPIFRGYVSFRECRAFLPIRFGHPFQKYHIVHPFGSGICLGKCCFQASWSKSKKCVDEVYTHFLTDNKCLFFVSLVFQIPPEVWCFDFVFWINPVTQKQKQGVWKPFFCQVKESVSNHTLLGIGVHNMSPIPGVAVAGGIHFF